VGDGDGGVPSEWDEHNQRPVFLPCLVANPPCYRLLVGLLLLSARASSASIGGGGNGRVSRSVL
jgi:hypothetical protein